MESNVLRFSLLSPDRQVLQSMEVASVVIPGTEGAIQILSGHARMIGQLVTGVCRATPAGANASEAPVVAVLSSGFFEVHDNHVMVMAETVELSHEVDGARAKRALERAEARIAQEALDDTQFKKNQWKLQRAIIRQQVASGIHSFD